MSFLVGVVLFAVVLFFPLKAGLEVTGFLGVYTVLGLSSTFGLSVKGTFEAEIPAKTSLGFLGFSFVPRK